MTNLLNATISILDAQQVALLAQAGGDNKGIILAVILAVVVLAVIAISFASRKGDQGLGGDAEVVEKPEEPEYERPTRSLLEDRVELTSEEYAELQRKKEAGELTMAESKIFSRAVIVDKEKGKPPSKTSRETAVEATRRNRQDHENIQPSEEPKAPVKAKEVEQEPKAKDEPAQVVATEAPEVKAPEPVLPSLEEASSVDDAWGDLASEVDDEDDAPIAAAVETPVKPVEEPKAPQAKPEVAPKAAEPVVASAPKADARDKLNVAQKSAKPDAAAAPKDDGGRSVVDGLARTRNSGFGSRFKSLFQGERISDNLLEEIEEFLYTADIGPKAAEEITSAIQEQVKAEDKRDPSAVWDFVRGYILQMLKRHEEPLDMSIHKPFVILVIGVNGAGKTTTIGKLASQFKRQGKSVLVVAGDTFRAAAVEQLEVWANRADLPLHRGESEADPASVVFDGITRGVEEGIDVVICDTSGRLQTKTNLMDELRKIGRVAGKALDGAPHETILVLDANTGQNAIQQVKTFGEVLNITGIVLTKLDGTARGGVILGIGKELNVPLRYIGIGEGINDLRPFKADEFAEALFL